MGSKKLKKNLKSRAKATTSKAAQKVMSSALEAKAVATDAALKVKVAAQQKLPSAAEHLEALRARFDHMKSSDISEKITIRIQSFRERSFAIVNNIWQKGFQKDGIQKLIITTGLGIATLVAAGIAEDRGRQVQSLKAAVTAQRQANQQLAQQVTQTQTEIDEKNLRLMVAEQSQRDEQIKMEQELERAKQSALKNFKSKDSKKSLAKTKKRSKKTMVATRNQKNTKSSRIQKKSELKVSKAE